MIYPTHSLSCFSWPIVFFLGFRVLVVLGKEKSLANARGWTPTRLEYETKKGDNPLFSQQKKFDHIEVVE